MEKEYDIYQRIKILGQGSYGKAYLVKDKQNQKKYVIKQMDIAGISEKQQKETLKQALILQRLNHPYIIKFKEVYISNKKKLNIVMEFAEGQFRLLGGDLAKQIQQKKKTGKYFEEKKILQWFTQICLAIKHVHDRKIIHRDVKGQNIFLKQQKCKLGDFGIAKVLKKTFQKAKTIIGTPYYLSPQIIENQPYSFQSDIWSIGVLLYQLCALKPPFNGQSLQFLALKIVKGQYEQIPSCFTNGMKNLIGSLLQVNPNRRPTINQILKNPIFASSIMTQMTQSQRISQFSHTILHNRQLFGEGLKSINVLSKCINNQQQKNKKKFEEKVEEQKKALQLKQLLRKKQAEKKKQELIKAEIQRKYLLQQKKKTQINKQEQQKLDKKNDYYNIPAINRIGLNPPSNYHYNRNKKVVNVNIQYDLPKARYDQIKVERKPQPKIISNQNDNKIIKQVLPKGFQNAMMNPAFQKNLMKNKNNRNQVKQKQIRKKQEKVSTSQKSRQNQDKHTQQSLEEKRKGWDENRKKMRQDIENRRIKQKWKKPITNNQQYQNKLQLKSQKQIEQNEKKSLSKEKQNRPKSLENKQKYQQQNQVKQVVQQELNYNLTYSMTFKPQQLKSMSLIKKQNQVINQFINNEDQKFNKYLKQKQGCELNQIQKQNIGIKKMLQELNQLVSNANQNVKDYPTIKTNFFDTQLSNIEQKIKQRQQDPIQPEKTLNLIKQIEQKILQVRKQDQQNLQYISDHSKLEGLRIDLQKRLGMQQFIKAYKILEKEMSQFGLNYIQQQYGKDQYKKKLNFIEEKILQKNITLLFTLIVMQQIQFSKQA